jgi:hypothetical protein
MATRVLTLEDGTFSNIAGGLYWFFDIKTISAAKSWTLNIGDIYRINDIPTTGYNIAVFTKKVDTAAADTLLMRSQFARGATSKGLLPGAYYATNSAYTNTSTSGFSIAGVINSPFIKAEITYAAVPATENLISLSLLSYGI